MANNWRRIQNLNDVAWPAEAVLICDEAVLQAAPTALVDRTITVHGGEDLKTMTSVEQLAARVLELRSTRPLLLVAMGGGSVGDAVGFLASILWRGVELWHVPTTLLAAVDSAHGGKTAVNLGAAKNQLGTFWEATSVLFADSFLQSMPDSLRAEGLTELVKALWLSDREALAPLDEIGTAALVYRPDAHADVLGALIDSAVAVKLDIVARDPREARGIRTWLNLGHTAAHGLELTCGASHGVAVAWGLAAAAALSTARSLLSADERDRLFGHVYPLLGTVPLEPDAVMFTEVLGRDKKRVDHRLRSVLLGDTGEPRVVDDVTAEDWLDAVMAVRDEVFDGDIRVSFEEPRAAALEMTSSKSEMNRALVIAALRGEDMGFGSAPEAEDVRAMRAGIAALRRGDCADAKNGGTTFRFLTAVAVSEPQGGRIRVGPQLASRPQQPLIDALRSVGVDVLVDGAIYTFGPLPPGDIAVRVDASQSSQFASALALLRATGRRVDLDLVGGVVASDGYLRMTEAMLDQRPPQVTADASSAAMWHIFNRLGGRVTLTRASSALQPDARLPELLWPPDRREPLEIDIGASPDLVPVLAAYAALTNPSVMLYGAPQLRHKESNRIEGLAAAFAEVGIEVDTLPDGVRLPAGRQSPTTGVWFDPRGDHRLAFAALLLATAEPLVIRNPRCVTKSYPGVFADAQRAGYRVELLG